MNIAQTVPLADTWGTHGDVGAGWMILMMVLMVLFWGAIISASSGSSVASFGAGRRPG